MGVFLNQVCGVWLCSLDLWFRVSEGNWKSWRTAAFLGEVAGVPREQRRMWGSGPQGGWWEGGGGREPCPLPLALPTGALQAWVVEVRSRGSRHGTAAALCRYLGTGFEVRCTQCRVGTQFLVQAILKQATNL